MKYKNKLSRGVSIIEMLIVISIFAVLGVVVTQSVSLTLRGSRKSEANIKVRENLGYTLGVIERQLRNANSITTCPNLDPLRIDYQDQADNPSSFSCSGSSVASGSASLTSDEVLVTSCSFTCVPGTGANPPQIDVLLVGRSAGNAGVESGNVTVSTKINLRTYY